MRTANPALREDMLSAAGLGTGLSVDQTRSSTMSIGGTVAKTAFLLIVCIAGAALAYGYIQTNRGLAMPVVMGGLVGSLVLGLIMTFKPASSPYLAPIYAAVEGAFLGAVSLAFAAKFGPTIIFQAVMLTFGIFAAMLGTFSLGLIRLGSTAVKCIVVASVGVGLVYLANMVMRMFGWGGMPFIHDSGPIGIGFSVVVIALASLNLVLDFQFIEEGVESRAPKYMEWYAGYGLLVTLVWLYLEILRLLGKLRSND